MPARPQAGPIGPLRPAKVRSITAVGGARLPGRPSFAGRQGELDAFRRALADGRCAGFLIAGGPGVGKTRLAEECLALAREDGHATETTAASTATVSTVEASTLGASTVGAGTVEASTVGAFPVTGPLSRLVAAGPHDRSVDPADLFGQAQRLVRDRLTDRGRLVLFADDLNRLDPVATTLIAQLLAAGSVFLLGTLRPGLPVGELALGLWSAGRAHRVDLAGLDSTAVEAVARGMLEGPVTADTAAALWTASRGNPLVLRELVTGALVGGGLVDLGGVWRLTGRLGATRQLERLVRARLAAAGPGTVAALELLALCEPVGLSLLTEVSSRAALEETEAAGLIEVSAAGRRREVRLAHPLYAPTIRAGLSRARTERVLRDHIRRIGASGGRRSRDPLLVATWQLAGAGGASRELLVRAAQLAHRAHNPALAARLARAAATTTRATPKPIAEPAAAWVGGADRTVDLIHAASLARLGQPAAALTVLATTQEAPPPGFALVRAGALAFGLGDVDQALRALDRPHAAQRAASALVLVSFGRPLGALDALEPLAGDDQASARPETTMHLVARTVTLAAAGRSQEALGEARLLLARLAPATAPTSGPATEAQVAEGSYAPGTSDIAADPLSVGHPAAALLAAAVAHHEAGLLLAAAELAERALRAAVADRQYGLQSASAFELARAFLTVGRLRQATQRFREAAALARAAGSGPLLVAARCGLAITLAQLGEGDGELAGSASEAGPSAAGPGLVARTTGWRLLAAGDGAGAVAALLAGVDEDLDGGHLASAAALLHDVARLGAAGRATRQLDRLAAQGDSPLTTARALYTRGRAHRDPALLTGAADAFEAMAADLYAAEALSAATTAHRERGEPRAATALAVRAATLADRCEGASTPGLALGAQPETLSAREQEICRLAAAGASSRDIAARLVLSVRTIDNHLQSAYAKLGVSRRGDLAAALGPADLAL